MLLMLLLQLQQQRASCCCCCWDAVQQGDDDDDQQQMSDMFFRVCVFVAEYCVHFEERIRYRATRGDQFEIIERRGPGGSGEESNP